VRRTSDDVVPVLDYPKCLDMPLLLWVPFVFHERCCPVRGLGEALRLGDLTARPDADQFAIMPSSSTRMDLLVGFSAAVRPT